MVFYVISIHALVKRATLCRHCTSYLQNISIHALAKRATCCDAEGRNRVRHFNPRPRKEGDRQFADFIKHVNKFQSTPSQRGRPSKPLVLSITSLFQSTPSQRGRHKAIFVRAKTYIISIHALAKRATANLYNDYLYFEAKYHISDIFPL